MVCCIMQVLPGKSIIASDICRGISKQCRIELSGLDASRRQPVGLSHLIAPPKPKNICGRAVGFRVCTSKAESSKGAKTAPEVEDGLGAFLRATEVLSLIAAGAFQICYLWLTFRKTNSVEKLRDGKVHQTVLAQVQPESVVTPTPLATSATILAVVISLGANLMGRWRSERRCSFYAWPYLQEAVKCVLVAPSLLSAATAHIVSLIVKGVLMFHDS